MFASLTLVSLNRESIMPMKILKSIIALVLIIFVVTIIYILFNTFTIESKQIVAEPVEKIDISLSSVDRFASAIQIPTISPENSKDFDSIQFNRFNIFLQNTYPLADSLLDHKMFNEYSHLYHWKGSDPALKPLILMGHLDVVPVIRAEQSLLERRSFWGKNCK